VNSSAGDLPTPQGPGSVSGAPSLPAGFSDTFASRYVDAAEVRLHAVIGGDGPPLLLVHGWPETWYAWRLMMPALARAFTGRPRPRAVRALRDRHRDADQLCPGGRSPGPCRAPGALRGASPGHLSLSAAAPSSAAQRADVAPRVQPASGGGERGARQGTGGRLLRRRVRRLGGTNKLPGETSPATSTGSRRNPMRCAAASGSTARFPPPARRTSNARTRA
jgi:hypothetical protein